MPRDVPSLKPRQLVRLLEKAGCRFYREGKGDHRLYVRYAEGRKFVVPIDMGLAELSPVYVLRILRQLRFTDAEIEEMLKG
jgi:predicted RNA binding protein YcfA (HicA-like mRNA interferase family)